MTDKIDGAVRAGYAVSRLRRARLGLIGYPFPGMGDFGLDTTQMAMTLGCDWKAIGIDAYHTRAEEAAESDVAELVTAYRDSYAVAADVTDDDLKDAARAELSLRSLVRDHRLDAFSYQFLTFGDDPRTQTLPFVAASRMLAEGIGFGGEGDLISAAGSAMLHALQPPASFSEMFTIDFAGNAVLLSHMGEASVAMARPDRKVPLVRRSEPIVPIRGHQRLLVPTFTPGQATLTALTLTVGQRWRIIASPVTIEDFGPIDGLAVPHTKVQPSRDVRDFLTAYAKAGGPHHLAICLGDARPKLAAVACHLGADYVEI
jgi:L-arabinose isomerase